MPAWGLIPDSPIFYYGAKALRVKHRRRSRSSYSARIRTSYGFTYKDLTLYESKLDYELNAMGGMVSQHLLKISYDIWLGARAQVGVKTGGLRASIYREHHRRGQFQEIRVGSRLSYAYAHHEGTKPRVITPNPPNKVLTFTKGSKLIRTTIVTHPGTRPNRFLSDQMRLHVR
jgi:hypothetical protein